MKWYPLYFLSVLGLFSACGTPEAQDALTADVADGEAPPAAEPAVEPAAEPPVDGLAKPTLHDDAKVFFTSPADGASVTSPVAIEFGLQGAEVKPAGENVDNSGHHHLIINGTGIEQGRVVPKDETHIHYGGGQTSAEVTLAPGQYTLTMQFANFQHLSYGAAAAASIKITVTE
jgi:hypothetical protein